LLAQGVVFGDGESQIRFVSMIRPGLSAVARQSADISGMLALWRVSD